MGGWVGGWVGRWVIVWSSAPTSVLMSSTKRFETEAKAADLAPGRAPSAAAFSRASARATISRATALVEVESTWRCMGDAWEMHGRCMGLQPGCMGLQRVGVGVGEGEGACEGRKGVRWGAGVPA